MPACTSGSRVRLSPVALAGRRLRRDGSVLPLTPLLTRGLHEVTRLPYRASGIVIANVVALAAFCVIWVLFREFVGSARRPPALPFSPSGPPASCSRWCSATVCCSCSHPRACWCCAASGGGPRSHSVCSRVSPAPTEWCSRCAPPGRPTSRTAGAGAGCPGFRCPGAPSASSAYLGYLSDRARQPDRVVHGGAPRLGEGLRLPGTTGGRTFTAMHHPTERRSRRRHPRRRHRCGSRRIDDHGCGCLRSSRSTPARSSYSRSVPARARACRDIASTRSRSSSFRDRARSTIRGLLIGCSTRRARALHAHRHAAAHHALICGCDPGPRSPVRCQTTGASGSAPGAAGRGCRGVRRGGLRRPGVARVPSRRRRRSRRPNRRRRGGSVGRSGGARPRSSGAAFVDEAAAPALVGDEEVIGGGPQEPPAAATDRSGNDVGVGDDHRDLVHRAQRDAPAQAVDETIDACPPPVRHAAVRRSRPEPPPRRSAGRATT